MAGQPSLVNGNSHISRISKQKGKCRRKNKTDLSPDSPSAEAGLGMEVSVTYAPADIWNMDCLRDPSLLSEFLLPGSPIPIRLVTGHDTVPQIRGIDLWMLSLN